MWGALKSFFAVAWLPIACGLALPALALLGQFARFVGDADKCGDSCNLQDWLMVGGTWFGVLAASGAGFLLWQQISDQRAQFKATLDIQMRDTKLRVLNDLRAVFTPFLVLEMEMRSVGISEDDDDFDVEEIVNSIGAHIRAFAECSEAIKSEAFDRLIYGSEDTELALAATSFDLVIASFSRRWIPSPRDMSRALPDEMGYADGYYFRRAHPGQYKIFISRVRQTLDDLILALHNIRKHYSIDHRAIFHARRGDSWRAAFPEPFDEA